MSHLDIYYDSLLVTCVTYSYRRSISLTVKWTVKSHLNTLFSDIDCTWVFSSGKWMNSFWKSKHSFYYLNENLPNLNSVEHFWLLLPINQTSSRLLCLICTKTPSVNMYLTSVLTTIFNKSPLQIWTSFPKVGLEHLTVVQSRRCNFLRSLTFTSSFRLLHVGSYKFRIRSLRHLYDGKYRLPYTVYTNSISKTLPLY